VPNFEPRTSFAAKFLRGHTKSPRIQASSSAAAYNHAAGYMPLEHEPLSSLGEGTARSSFFIYSLFFFASMHPKRRQKNLALYVR
jgi:hypothetical protein